MGNTFRFGGRCRCHGRSVQSWKKAYGSSRALQEAKASSEIENIVTTQDELLQVDLFHEGPGSPEAKEVELYRDALKLGLATLRDNGGLITNRAIVEMFCLLKGRADGFRALPGTELR